MKPLALAVLIALSPLAADAPSTCPASRPTTRTSTRPGPGTRPASRPALTVREFRGPGIGKARIERGGGWPSTIRLRLHLRGLESLKIAAGATVWQASVTSHSGHAVTICLVREGREGPPLAADSPYWTAIGVFDAAGNPVAGLPPAGGWFELDVPAPLLRPEVEALELGWIDFYR